MDLLLPLDRAARPRRPLRDQLYDGLRDAILDGRMVAEARLPATRVLALQLGVSRFTVEDAFARLVAEGFVVGRQGAGTFVAPGVADLGPTGASLTPEATTPPGPLGNRGWSAWGARLSAGPVDRAWSVPGAEFIFRAGVPALDAFPHKRWSRLRAAAEREVSLSMRDYGPSGGFPPLRAAIAGYLARSRGIACGPERVVITSGARQAIDLLARIWLDPGDVVAVEEPGYPATRRVLAAAGARLVPVPVDGEGLPIEVLAERAPTAKLVLVTPSHQYPTGGVLPLARRRALLAWARQRGALVVEDDYDGEFRYGARPIPALAGLDGPDGAVVVYVGTFSKVLYPSLRLGYALLPADMTARFASAKEVADHQSPTVDQAAVAAFLLGGHFERHLARMRRLYAARHLALVDALAAEFGMVVRREPLTTAAGLHVLTGFALPMSEGELVARAASAGVALDAAGSCYACAPPRWPSALLGYGLMTEEQIREGVRRLRRALLS